MPCDVNVSEQRLISALLDATTEVPCRLRSENLELFILSIKSRKALLRL